MQSIYWFCFIIGGVFVAIATLGGQSELEFDTDTDFDLASGLDTNVDLDGDADADVDAAVEAEVEADGGLDSHVSTDMDLAIDTDVALTREPLQQLILVKTWKTALGIVTSFKFWTMGSCFFGLTGLVLSRVQPDWSGPIIFSLALIMGLICGTGLAAALRALRRRQVDSLVRNEDFAGLVGTVELPFDYQSKGKISLEIRGNTLHMIALTDDRKSFLPGDKVLIIGASNNRLWVVSTETADNP